MLNRSYYKDNLKLAYPIILSSLGQSVVQFFDTLMVGHLGKEALAGVAFSAAITTIALVFGQGIGMALTPLIGQSYARKETSRMSMIFQNAITLNILTGAAIVAVLMLLVPLLPYFGQPKEVTDAAKSYFIITAISLFPAQIFLAFRHFMEGVGNTKTTMQIIISANLLNIILNYIFIFGKCGFPAMGTFGAGLSTYVARSLMPAAYLAYMLWHKHYRKYFKFFAKRNFTLHMHKNILRLALPIAVQLSLECISFSMVTIMMGWLSTVALAAYQIVLTFITLTFQIACGIASATTILVSHAFGVKDSLLLRNRSLSGLHLSFVSMGIAACCFISIGGSMASLFTDDCAVIAQARTLFIVAGAFQLLDGAQATLLGALRGMNDVAKPMKYSLVCYILFAIPAAGLLGFAFELGPCGILSGLAFGLLLATTLYYLRLKTTIRRNCLEK